MVQSERLSSAARLAVGGAVQSAEEAGVASPRGRSWGVTSALARRGAEGLARHNDLDDLMPFVGHCVRVVVVPKPKLARGRGRIVQKRVANREKTGISNAARSARGRPFGNRHLGRRWRLAADETDQRQDRSVSIYAILPRIGRRPVGIRVAKQLGVARPRAIYLGVDPQMFAVRDRQARINPRLVGVDWERPMTSYLLARSRHRGCQVLIRPPTSIRLRRGG